jgi:alpha-beta hydrolase superfamily lysophospholipase
VSYAKLLLFLPKFLFMSYTNHTFKTPDGKALTTYHWDCERPKAIVHIVHGMSEHAARYNEFAEFLNEHGYVVRSSDLRGHGKTAGNLENVGHFSMENGWNKVVKDVKALTEHFQHKTNLPIILLGHSMGSFLVRTVMFSYPKVGDAYILSATAGHPGILGSLGKTVAHFNMKFMGKKNRSELMTKLVFGDFNKKYKSPRTIKDWLSRDEAVVDAYINDPYCMQTFSSQFYNDLLQGILAINDEQNIQKSPKQKPVYMFAGDMDPVGNYGKGPAEVYAAFQKAGIEDVELKIYPEGRHEMLNETNKEEVYDDVLNWLDERIK